MDFTQHWHWPQWAAAFILFTGFLIEGARNGQQKLQSAGEEKGKPYRYSTGAAFGRCVLWGSILYCGGFFQ